MARAGTNLYVGGVFAASYTGDSVWCIARWNGSKWFPLGDGMNRAVRAIAVSGTNVFAGGDFTAASGVNASRIARWDGSAWHPLGSGLNGTVWAIAVSGNDVYVGGEFTTAGGLFANNIARWNGSGWSSMGTGVNGTVRAIAIRDASVYIGGSFIAAGALAVNNVACWDGNNWSALGTGVNNSVFALTLNAADLFAGGRFSQAGGNSANGIARWDGTAWHALGRGVEKPGPWKSGERGTPGFPKELEAGDVAALALDGIDLYAAGGFIVAGGRPSQGFAHWIVPPTAPRLTDPARRWSGQFEFLLQGVTGASYTIEVSTDLSGTNWAPLLTTNAPSSSFSVGDDQATNAQRFYRAVQ
jgi:hypothetical protein